MSDFNFLGLREAAEHHGQDGEEAALNELHDRVEALRSALLDVIRLELGENYDGSTPAQAAAMKRARAAIARSVAEHGGECVCDGCRVAIQDAAREAGF